MVGTTLHRFAPCLKAVWLCLLLPILTVFLSGPAPAQYSGGGYGSDHWDISLQLRGYSTAQPYPPLDNVAYQAISRDIQNYTNDNSTGVIAGSDNDNGHHIPGTATISLVVTPILRWYNQRNTGYGTSQPPELIVYHVQSHASSSGGERGTVYNGVVTDGQADAADGLGDPNTYSPAEADSAGIRARTYNNSGHSLEVQLPAISMSASATGTYLRDSAGQIIEARGSYARLGISFGVVQGGLSWGRGDGPHKPMGGGHPTNSSDPSFTRWLPLAFSPNISSQPYRYAAGNLPAPWGNLNCAYSIRFHVLPRDQNNVGLPFNNDANGTSAIYTYSVDGTQGYIWFEPPTITPAYEITDANADRLLFTLPYQAYGEIHSHLASLSGGGWRLSDAGPPGALKEKGRYTYTFDAEGKLTQLADDIGNTQTLTYGANPYLRVTDSSSGRQLSFNRSGAGGYLTSVDAPGLAQGTVLTHTTLDYDGGGHLTDIKVYGGSTLLHTDHFAYGGPNGDSVTSEAQGVSTAGYTWTGDPFLIDPYGVPLPRLTSSVFGLAGDTSSSDDGGSVQGTMVYSYGVMTAGPGNVSEAAHTNTVTDPRGNVFSTVFTLAGASGQLLALNDSSVGGAENTSDYLYTDTIGGPINGSKTTGPDYTGATVGSNVSTVSYYPNVVQPDSVHMTDALGNSWFSFLNGQGNPVKVKDPLNSAWQFRYDVLGTELTGTTDPTGLVWTYNYGEGGAPASRLTSLSDPGGLTRLNVTYNPFGQVLTETVPAAASASGGAETTSYTYDSIQGDLLQVSNPLGETQRLGDYDALGDAGSVTVFPDTGLLATSQTPLTTSVFYDAAQMPQRITDASGTSQVTTFNNGIATQFQITGPGNSLLAQMNLSRDTRGRVYGASDLVGSLAQYRYDKSSNRTKVMDGNGNTTRFSYGPNNEPTGVTWPGNHSASLLYDAAGRVRQSTDERGIETDYVYDNADRLTDIQFPSASGQDQHFDYDPAGRVNSVSDATGGRVYHYDAVRKRLQSVDVTLGGRVYTISYTYKPDGSLNTMTSLAGTEGYNYDAAGRMTALVSNNGQTSWTYDHAGRITSESTQAFEGSGATFLTTFTWGVSGLTGDPSTAPTYLRSVQQSLNGIAAATYTRTHSLLGQLVQQTESGGETLTYGYDARGRLASETMDIASGMYGGAYSFDLSGNLNAGANGWTYNSANQATAAPALPGLDGGTNLTYDAAGNLTRLNNQLFTWDVWGHLATATSPDGSSLTTYTYDAAGRRVSKTVGVNGQPVYYLYSGDRLVCSLNPAGQVIRSYVWGALGLINDWTNGTGGNQSRFYLSDGSASTRVMYGPSGGVALGYSVYSAWGTGSSGSGALPADTNFTWNGRAGAYKDTETGLYLMGARYYSPALGRFLSRDPSGFGSGPNLYAYCFGDPLNFLDINGMEGGGFIQWYMGGMGGLSDWVDDHIMDGSTARFGNTAGRYDAGKASAWELARDGGAFAYNLGSAAFAAKDAAQILTKEGLKLACKTGLRPGGCFVAGTLVTDQNGKTKPIEHYSQGETLASRNEKANADKSSVFLGQPFTEGKHIQSTSVRTVDTVLTVSLADSRTGKIVDSVTATRNHPFFVDGRGWTPAGGLAIGNAIVTRAGPPLLVAKVEWKRRPEGYQVYNFVVEDDHTYFVGKANGGVWVHNGLPCPIKRLKPQQEASKIRKIDNAIRDHVKPTDISGTLKDMLGNDVPNPAGGFYKHDMEMRETLDGLRKNAEALSNSGNPASQAARQRALQKIQEIEEALGGTGI